MHQAFGTRSWDRTPAEFPRGRRNGFIGAGSLARSLSLSLLLIVEEDYDIETDWSFYTQSDRPRWINSSESCDKLRLESKSPSPGSDRSI